MNCLMCCTGLHMVWRWGEQFEKRLLMHRNARKLDEGTNRQLLQLCNEQDLLGRFVQASMHKKLAMEHQMGTGILCAVRSATQVPRHNLLQDWRAARCNPKLCALPSSSAGTWPSDPGQAACTKDRLARSEIPTLWLSGKLPINCQ
jgi:hypothetical protein